MLKRPRYTDEFRTGAVLLLEAAGWPDRKGALREVSAKLGMYDATLARWARRQQNPPPSELVNEKRLEVEDIVNLIFQGFSDEIITRVEAGDLIDENLSTLLTGWGVSFDKGRLLAGKPTAINEEQVSDARGKLAQQLDRLNAVREAAEPARRTN